MDKHPIEGIMTTTMESIRDMVDVNTVIGEPIACGDGTTIIPISRVSFGFVAGGGEYSCNGAKRDPAQANQEGLPFGGGTGAGVSVVPMGFLAVNGESVRLMPAEYQDTGERIVGLVPQVLTELKCFLKDRNQKKCQQAANMPTVTE